MIIYSERRWLSLFILKHAATSAKYILPPALLSAGMGVLAWYIQIYWYKYTPETTAHTIAGTIISFLLTFRANQSFSRFVEASQLVMNVAKFARDLMSMFCAYAAGDKAPEARKEMGRLISGAVALEINYLRGEEGDVVQYTPEEDDMIEQAVSKPWVGLHLLRCHLFKCNDTKVYPDRLLSAADGNIQLLANTISSLDKIRNFPYPFPFAQMTFFFLLFWSTTLPFCLVKGLGSFTPIASFFISLFFWAINEIGITLENPFGKDSHDLPLEEVFMVVERDVADLMVLAESFSKPAASIASDQKSTENETNPNSEEPLRGESAGEQQSEMQFFGIPVREMTAARSLHSHLVARKTFQTREAEEQDFLGGSRRIKGLAMPFFQSSKVVPSANELS